MNTIDNIIWQSKFEAKKNWLKAVKVLEEGVREFGHDERLFLQLADVYAAKKIYKKAIEYYQKASELDPENMNILFRLGNCYLSMNEVNVALYYYDKIDPLFPEAMYNMAIALSKQGKLQKSIKVLEDIAELKPDSELPYFFLIEQYLSYKEYDKAIEKLNIVETKFGRNGKICFLRGIAFSYQKNWLKAYIEFQAAEKLKYRTANYYRAFGITASKIGKSNQAVDLLLESIKLEPFNLTTYLDLINIYITQERLLEAYKIVEHAKRIGPFSDALSLIHNKIIHMIKRKYGEDHPIFDE